MGKKQNKSENENVNENIASNNIDLSEQDRRLEEYFNKNIKQNGEAETEKEPEIKEEKPQFVFSPETKNEIESREEFEKQKTLEEEERIKQKKLQISIEKNKALQEKKDKLLSDLTERQKKLISSFDGGVDEKKRLKKEFFQKFAGKDKTIKDNLNILKISLKEAQTESELKKVRDQIKKQEEVSKKEIERAKKEKELKIKKEEEQRLRHEQIEKNRQLKAEKTAERIKKRDEDRKNKTYSFEKVELNKEEIKSQKFKKPLRKRLWFIMLITLIFIGAGIAGYFIISNLLTKPPELPTGFVITLDTQDEYDGKVKWDEHNKKIIVQDDFSMKLQFDNSFKAKEKISVSTSYGSLFTINNQFAVDVSNNSVLEIQRTTIDGLKVGGTAKLLIEYLTVSQTYTLVFDKEIDSLMLSANKNNLITEGQALLTTKILCDTGEIEKNIIDRDIVWKFKTSAEAEYTDTVPAICEFNGGVLKGLAPGDIYIIAEVKKSLFSNEIIQSNEIIINITSE